MELDCDSVLPSVIAFVPSEEVSSLVVDLDHQGSGEKERRGRGEKREGEIVIYIYKQDVVWPDLIVVWTFWIQSATCPRVHVSAYTQNC